MTVLTTDNRRAYTGDGSTSVYPFPVRFLSDADVKVAQRVNDEEVLLTIGTDYSVSGAGEATGGSVTFVNAPAAGVPIVIYNDPPMTQDVDYQEDDEFPANTHERALDKLTILVQRLAGRLSRALLYDETADSVLTASQVLGRVGDAETARDQAQAAQVASESAKTDAEAARDAAQATAASVDGPTLQAGIDANAVAIAGKADHTAVDAVNTELDAVLPDGGTGTFTRPRMTTTARDALDMTGKAAGYEIYNTTTGQVEAWDGVGVWGASGETVATGAWRNYFLNDVPSSGWSFKYVAYAFSGSTVDAHTIPSNLSNEFLVLSGDYACVFDGNSSNANDPGYRIHRTTGVVTTMPAQPVSRTYYGATCVLDNGMILLVGGYDQAASNAARNTWWIYDPATNTFPHNGTFIGGTVHSAKLVRANDGAVYLFHGNVNSGANQNIYKFDQTTRVWTDTGINTTRANSSMSYHACGLLPSGKIGIFHSPSGTDQCDIFDPAGPSIAQGGVIGHANVTWAGQLVVGSETLFCFQRSADLYKYDEATEAIVHVGQANNFSYTSGHSRDPVTFATYLPSGTSIEAYLFTFVMEKDA